MMIEKNYPTGRLGRKWGEPERQKWLAIQRVKRSYQGDVLSKLALLDADFDIVQYGALSFDIDRYPLFAVQSKDWRAHKPSVLVTGGVHGYETSGVHGAINFLETHAQDYREIFNFLVVPCVSPWAYETINRWNPYCVDPNRSFVDNSSAQESAMLMSFIDSLNVEFMVHIDLHETTDSDNSEFRPALAARDNTVHQVWDIPDGFYLVGDSEKPNHDFQAHIIHGVSAVTHIAPSDDHGKIIGVKTTQRGVINYANRALGLCAGFSNADFCTTTEVYPDSPKVDDENCIQAQVTAVCSGLDYLIQTSAIEL